MPFSFRLRSSIDRRFRIIVVVIYLLLVPLVIRAMTQQWNEYADARAAERDTVIFREGMRTMVSLSIERAATLRALDANGPGPAAIRRPLDDARQLLDEHLARLGRRIATGGCLRCEAMEAELANTRGILADSRKRIDAVLAVPRSARSPDAIDDALLRVMAISPRLSTIAGESAAGMVNQDADALQYLIVAGFAAQMRDNAGLLASQLGTALVAKRPLDPDETALINQTIGKLYLLQIQARSVAGRAPALSLGLFAPINQRYFGEGIRYVRQAGALAGKPDAPSVVTFIDHYLPLTQPIVELRDSALHAADHVLDGAERRAALLLLAVAIALVILTGLLVTMVWQFHHQIVIPFSQARVFVHAIAAGNLSAEIPSRRYHGEIGRLFRALRVLKRNSADRLRLEGERERLIGELRTLAETDPLTGLLNRRAFELQAQMLLDDRRHHEAYVVMTMFDIDHFKRINDTYGHETGDLALMRLAQLCGEAWRSGDLVGRIGGEEFAALACVSRAEEATSAAQRLMDGLHAEQMQTIDGRVFTMTVSFGVTSVRHVLHPRLAVLLRHGDALLYRAKTAGRDRIEADTLPDSAMADPA